MNYHSRLPILSGTVPGVEAGDISTLATYIAAGRGNLALQPVIQGIIEPAYTSGGMLGLTRAMAALSVSANALLLPYGEYLVEYPEDIELYGLSFSTTYDLGLPGGETSISGEISYRPDQPMQIEDGSILPGMIGLPSQFCDGSATFECFEYLDPGEFVSGAYRGGFLQTELAFVHFFDRLLAAERWTVVFDVAVDQANIPEYGDLLLNSDYNASLCAKWGVGGAINAAATAGTNSLCAGLTPEDRMYPTELSWGYKLRFSGSYPDVFAGINLKPGITLSHDVNGVTPGPAGNFLEGRKAVALDLTAEYLTNYSVDLVYANFFGAEPWNLNNDRDYVAISASASF